MSSLRVKVDEEAECLFPTVAVPSVDVLLLPPPNRLLVSTDVVPRRRSAEWKTGVLVIIETHPVLGPVELAP